MVNIYQAINKVKLGMFCIDLYCSRAYSWTIFFYLSSACLSNKPKTKVQAWLICKQTNIKELFIEPNMSCSWIAWYVYSPMCIFENYLFMFMIVYHIYIKLKRKENSIKLSISVRLSALKLYFSCVLGSHGIVHGATKLSKMQIFR